MLILNGEGHFALPLPACPALSGHLLLLVFTTQLLVEETEELLTASLAAMRANLQQTPAWSLAPPPTDDFLLMFLRTEVFCPSAAADRYRKFWKVGCIFHFLRSRRLPPPFLASRRKPVNLELFRPPGLIYSHSLPSIEKVPYTHMSSAQLSPDLFYCRNRSGFQHSCFSLCQVSQQAPRSRTTSAHHLFSPCRVLRGRRFRPSPKKHKNNETRKNAGGERLLPVST